MFVFDKGRP
jgi:hypothetical protein